MWSSRLFWRIFVSFAALNLLVTSLTVIVVSSWMKAQVRSGLNDRLLDAAAAVGQNWRDDASPDELSRYARELSREMGTRVTFATAEGRVLADSAADSSADLSAWPVQTGDEIREARTTGLSSVQRDDPEVHAEMIYVALRIDDEGVARGIVRTGLPATRVDQAVASASRLLWTLACIASASFLAILYAFALRIFRPIARLTEAAEAIADGDYKQQVYVPNRDELGGLARVFNRMSRQLQLREAELHDSRERLSGVLGGMSVGVIAVDDEERIIFANATAGRMLGFVPEQVECGPLLASVRNHKLYRAIQETRATTTSRQLEIQVGLREPRIVDVSLRYLGGDSTARVILGLHDVTHLRRLETLRRDFVANVSHELKTPLSAIKAYAETLSAGAIHDRANNLRFVQQIEEQAERLNVLIMDLIRLAQIESGQQQYQLGPLSVAEAAGACVTSYRPLAQSRGVALTTPAGAADAIVLADDEALRQILNNLLDNALKYTPRGGRVELRWRVVDSIGEIEVEDNGIGIAEEHLDRLFERFFRVDRARSRELGGTGLGLSIVKHLVQAQGGSVHVSSQLGQGSTFSIRLPLA